MEEFRRLCRFRDNITMDLEKIGVVVMNWMEYAQDKDYRGTVKVALNLRVP